MPSKAAVKKGGAFEIFNITSFGVVYIVLFVRWGAREPFRMFCTPLLEPAWKVFPHRAFGQEA